MKNDRLINWLNNWKRNLLEVFVIAGIIASACTTFAGAYQLVNRSYLVAGLFTLFFQGGLYIVGHYVSPNEQERRHRRRFALCLVWLLLAFFSVWASAIGMYALQQESIRSDDFRTRVVKQWGESQKNIAEFKTRALAEITQAKQSVTLEIAAERARIRVARAQQRPFSTENLQRLNSDLNALQNAETTMRRLHTLGITPPDSTEIARNILDEAYASTGEAYAAMPERLRARISQPRPIEQPEISENIQKAFWEGLKTRSVPVVLMLLFACFLDLLPPMVLFATAPRPTLGDRILAVRRWARELQNRWRVPLTEDVEVVQLRIEDAPGLHAYIKVPAHVGGPLLDIDRDFAEVSKEVGREMGREMLLAGVKTASGKPLVDGAPLLAQLGDEREVVLSYAPAVDSDFDADSREVN